MRLSQILNHPFMREQPAVSQASPLPTSQLSLMKGAHPYSQASLDSGQYTMSSSLSQSVNRSGPMKAIVRPHGIEHHIPLSSIASSNSQSHSRHHSTNSILSKKPSHSHRKAHSIDGVHSTKQPLQSSSVHSRPITTKHQSMSCEDLRSSNKENTPTHTRKRRAKSDFEPSRALSAHSTNPLYKEQYRGASSAQQQPFRDMTNTLRSVQSEERKTRAAAATVVGSLKELVPPLNAARLRPIKQQTRSAIVSALLCFGFSHEKLFAKKKKRTHFAFR